MAPTIFYSWQSDSDQKTNHRFIKECLEEAISTLVDDGQIDVAPRLDHDMKGVHGDQDVVPTILGKIDVCDIFVADITIVAETDTGKNIPNPNVLLELGYAYQAVGSGRIIKIMNTAHGHPEKGLPFDLAYKRWPYTYSLPSGTQKKDREKIKKNVVSDFTKILSSIIEKEGVKGNNQVNKKLQAIKYLISKELKINNTSLIYLKQVYDMISHLYDANKTPKVFIHTNKFGDDSVHYQFSDDIRTISHLPLSVFVFDTYKSQLTALAELDIELAKNIENTYSNLIKMDELR